MLDCPAHAGIDLYNACYLIFYFGLPRARGDRPAFLSVQYPSALTAPRTRGSTLVKYIDAGGKTDCPAHAGIDLLPAGIKSRF